METAVVTNIQGYSIHDGPGIRTVVFLKGCPLRCNWCANPENLTAAAEIGFLKNLCKNCGKCAGKCPADAIVPGEAVYRIDRNKCNGCGSCVDVCFYGALVRYGDLFTSEEVFNKVKRDKMFYDSSGGGVTVSGGEPLIYPEFVYELFSCCKAAGINTCIETCGYAPATALRRVLPVTDWVYFDLKHLDPAAHKEHTGHSNKQILENARLAAAEASNILFRLPLIPGVNDGDNNIRETADFIKLSGSEAAGIQLMPYHRAGQVKYEALDMTYMTSGLDIMKEDQIEAIKQKFIDFGVYCTIST